MYSSHEPFRKLTYPPEIDSKNLAEGEGIFSSFPGRLLDMFLRALISGPDVDSFDLIWYICFAGHLKTTFDFG